MGLMAGRGPDGNPKEVSVTSDGKIPVEATIPPVTVDTTGLATEAKQDAGIAKLTSIDGHLTKADTDHVTVSAALPAGANTIGAVTGPAAAALATAAKQDTGNTSLASIDSKLPASPATSGKQDTGNTSLSSIDGKLAALGQHAAAGSTSVVLASDQATIPVSAAALPLPALAATSTKQSDGTQKTQVVDASGNIHPAADVIARAAFQQLTDATTGPVAVKAASTAAAATDKALVVSLSPNSPLGAGSALIGKATIQAGAKGATAAADVTSTAQGTDHNGLDVFVRDGSGNAQPAGDAATRPIFEQLSDGAAAYTAAKTGQLPTALGQTTMAASVSVALASNQSNVPVAGPAAAGAAVSGNPLQCGGKDGSGNAQPILLSAAGIQQTALAKGTHVGSSAAEKSRVIAAVASLPLFLGFANINVSTRIGMFLNSTSLPADGAVPIDQLSLATNSRTSMTYPIPHDGFGTGCTAACSTTFGTLTITSTNDAYFHVVLAPANT